MVSVNGFSHYDGPNSLWAGWKGKGGKTLASNLAVFGLNSGGDFWDFTSRLHESFHLQNQLLELFEGHSELLGPSELFGTFCATGFKIQL